jgi:hypothetical protein
MRPSRLLTNNQKFPYFQFDEFGGGSLILIYVNDCAVKNDSGKQKFV